MDKTMKRAEEIIRLYYYDDTMPYFVDVGPEIQAGEVVTIDTILFEIYKVRQNDNEEIQRLWIKRVAASSAD
ncbi:MAG: hypothetical protein GF401_19345 [Chitinivibrionales bacterium]|nr:hypothetical protein [Chitinivibrionales bacterium]